MSQHESCRLPDCDCDCAGCNPANCAQCPHCGAEYDATPEHGGVTDPIYSPSYEDLPPYNDPIWDLPGYAAAHNPATKK